AQTAAKAQDCYDVRANVKARELGADSLERLLDNSPNPLIQHDHRLSLVRQAIKGAGDDVPTRNAYSRRPDSRKSRHGTSDIRYFEKNGLPFMRREFSRLKLLATSFLMFS